MNKQFQRYYDLDLCEYVDDRNVVSEDDEAKCRMDLRGDISIENVAVKARRNGPRRWLFKDSQLFIHDDCWIYLDHGRGQLKAGDVLYFKDTTEIVIGNRNLLQTVRYTIVQKIK